MKRTELGLCCFHILTIAPSIHHPLPALMLSFSPSFPFLFLRFLVSLPASFYHYNRFLYQSFFFFLLLVRPSIYVSRIILFFLLFLSLSSCLLCQNNSLSFKLLRCSARGNMTWATWRVIVSEVEASFAAKQIRILYPSLQIPSLVFG